MPGGWRKEKGMRLTDVIKLSFNVAYVSTQQHYLLPLDFTDLMMHSTSRHLLTYNKAVGKRFHYATGCLIQHVDIVDL